MSAMRPMERRIEIMASYQGYKGLSYSRDRVVCRGSVNRSRAGIQMVSKGGTEEDFEYNISCQ